jgi:hypothetical protein
MGEYLQEMSMEEERKDEGEKESQESCTEQIEEICSICINSSGHGIEATFSRILLGNGA